MMGDNDRQTATTDASTAREVYEELRADGDEFYNALADARRMIEAGREKVRKTRKKARARWRGHVERLEQVLPVVEDSLALQQIRAALARAKVSGTELPDRLVWEMPEDLDQAELRAANDTLAARIGSATLGELGIGAEELAALGMKTTGIAVLSGATLSDLGAHHG